VQSLTIGQTAYLVNNLPYAVPLEYGHSKQAPGGMVRITLARFQQVVDEAIRNNQV
jgi:nitroimidazol reductase NimA-like FMN-containing flavoprotein (pyridoxamine 5'-phosphate oxidase superfamily)